MGFPSGSDGKASARTVGDPGSILGWGRSPGEWNGNPLQHSCLENPMDGYVPQLFYLFICWWTSRLLPCPSYCKWCCNEHQQALLFLREVLGSQQDWVEIVVLPLPWAPTVSIPDCEHPPPAVLLLQQVNLHWHIAGTRSPRFTSEFILDVVRSVGWDKWEMPCSRHCSVAPSSFIAPRRLRPPRFTPPSPNTWQPPISLLTL